MGVVGAALRFTTPFVGWHAQSVAMGVVGAIVEQPTPFGLTASGTCHTLRDLGLGIGDSTLAGLSLRVIRMHRLMLCSLGQAQCGPTCLTSPLPMPGTQRL
mgnify:CR=1 FL=1